MKQLINKYLASHSKIQFYYLLASVALFLLLPPFTLHVPFSILIIYGTVSFVIISCIIILFSQSKKVTVGSGILLVSLTFTWFTLSPVLDNFLVMQIIKPLLLSILFGATAFKVIHSVLSIKKVNAQVIAGSIGAYLLFGLSGAMLFDLIDVIYPASFDHSVSYGGGYDMVYFSLVTLSTLGYGDIPPHTPQGAGSSNFDIHYWSTLSGHFNGYAGRQVFKRF